MGDQLKYERFIWFHNRIKAGKYPNARHLSEKFEISQRTAQRDIEFIRDRVNAPIKYDHVRRGFFYTNDAYELPSQWYDQDNVMAFALAVRLASTIPDTEIKQDLIDFIKKIVSNNQSDKKLNIEEISEKISVKNIEFSRVNEKFFHSIVNALFQNTPLLITYYSPHTNKRTDRTILPLHLIHYMGSWHIIAFCKLRNDLRDFSLSRIQSVSASKESVTLPANIPSIKEYSRKHFGIIQGGRTTEVKLKFSRAVSAWMIEQVWHPSQNVTLCEDGSLDMMFPAADFRELKRRILSYGADVQVEYPQELVNEVKEEIEKMGKVYKT